MSSSTVIRWTWSPEVRLDMTGHDELTLMSPKYKKMKMPKAIPLVSSIRTWSLGRWVCCSESEVVLEVGTFKRVFRGKREEDRPRDIRPPRRPAPRVSTWQFVWFGGWCKGCWWPKAGYIKCGNLMGRKSTIAPHNSHLLPTYNQYNPHAHIIPTYATQIINNSTFSFQGAQLPMQKSTICQWAKCGHWAKGWCGYVVERMLIWGGLSPDTTLKEVGNGQNVGRMLMWASCWEDVDMCWFLPAVKPHRSMDGIWPPPPHCILLMEGFGSQRDMWT